MRVCYFVQSHRDPAQIARLVATIKRSSPTAHVLVGHDARRCALTRADLPGLPGVDLFFPPGPIERGRLSLLSPYWLAIEHLARTGFDYDWLVYLSGQDYPTGPLAGAEAFLRDSGADGCLRYWEAFAPINPWGRRLQGVIRYRFQYTDAPRWLAPVLRALLFLNRVQTLVHAHLVYGPRIGVRARATPFGSGRICYAGSQWTSLSRACVEYLAERRRAEPELIAYYERTICPDESLVQTLLVNSGRFRLLNDDLRYADFHGSRDGSPRTLTRADFATLADGRYHFARKFDAAVDATILDLLDRRIFGTGAAVPSAG